MLVDFLEHEALNAYSRLEGLLERYRSHDKKIGSGDSRVVILREFSGIKVAIKFVLSHDGADNQKEWDAWQVMPEAVRKITAEPYAISKCGRVIAFEYIPQTAREFFGDDPLMDQRITEFNQELTRGFYQEMTWGCPFAKAKIDQLLSDNRPENIGVRPDGSLVWIDFASYVL